MRTTLTLAACLALSLAAPVLAQETAPSTATAPATQVAVPQDLQDLMAKLEKLAADSKWDAIIDLIAPPEMVKNLTPERRAQIAVRLSDNDLFLNSLKAAKKVTPQVAEDRVEYKLGGGEKLKDLIFVKKDDRWLLR